MQFIKIPRGTIYQKISDQIKDLIFILFSSLDNKKQVQSFEKKFASYVNINYCHSFPLARVAIYSALKSQKFKKDSEILMPPITIKPILDVVIDLGLKPVFVDLNKNSLCFDEKDLKKKINKNTKACIITYLFGMVPNVELLIKLLNKKNIFTIEDFSQCLNGEYKKKNIGTFAKVGVYSASSIKPLDTYGGGFLVCKNKEIYKKINLEKEKLLSCSRLVLFNKILINITRSVFTNKFIFSFFTFYLIKWSQIFLNKKNTKMLGDRSKKPLKKLPKDWFVKYSSFQANIGFRKIDQIKKEDEKRIRVAKKIKQNNKLIKFPSGVKSSKNVYWQLLGFCNSPLLTKLKLMRYGVDSSSSSLEYLPSLKNYGFKSKLKNAEFIYKKSLLIPCFSKLNDSDVNIINSSLKKINF
jgi:dTDP-4-amino-4,6-dideoxygalactose transaminase